MLRVFDDVKLPVKLRDGEGTKLCVADSLWLLVPVRVLVLVTVGVGGGVMVVVSVALCITVPCEFETLIDGEWLVLLVPLLLGLTVWECDTEELGECDGVPPVNEKLSKNVKLNVFVGVRYVSCVLEKLPVREDERRLRVTVSIEEFVRESDGDMLGVSVADVLLSSLGERENVRLPRLGDKDNDGARDGDGLCVDDELLETEGNNVPEAE